MSKSFGNTHALTDVCFEIAAGEIHALAGANGAGKSTLIKILAGVHPCDSGSVLWEGRPVRFDGPRAAAAAGIATIHQELSLVGSLSVEDNLALVLPKPLLGASRRAQSRERARAVLQRHQLEVAPDALVEELALGQRQLLEIARALALDAKLLILDEPTSALQEQEAERLFNWLERLRAEGTSILYISHRMEELYRLADRVTVLRDGRNVGTERLADVSRDELVAAMVGEHLAPPATALESPREKSVRLEARDLHATSGSQRVHAVSLAVGAGEILGLAGLQGSGASALLATIGGGAVGPIAGRLHVDGVPCRFRSPRQAIAHGVVSLGADRALSVLASMSICDNAMLSSLRRYSAVGLLRRGQAMQEIEASARELKLKAASFEAPAADLSGGNQQKVALMRCLLAEPRVLLLDEPTRGIDIAAKSDVYRLIRKLAQRGVTIVLASTELDELALLCHRVLIMEQGRIACELSQGALTRQRLLAAMMGGAA